MAASIDDLPARVEQLEAHQAELQSAVRELRDIRAIEQLMIRFMKAADVMDDGEAGGYESQVIADLFTEDGIMDEGPEINIVLQGRAEIKAFYDDARANWIKFGVHYLIAPSVEVDGDTARGSWYFLEPFTYAQDSRDYWCAARWENEFVRADDAWFIKRANFRPFFMAPHDRGWGQQRWPWEAADTASSA